MTTNSTDLKKEPATMAQFRRLSQLASQMAVPALNRTQARYGKLIFKVLIIWYLCIIILLL